MNSKTASSCPPLLGKLSHRDKSLCGVRTPAIHQNRIFVFNLGSSSSSKTMFRGHGKFGKRSRNCVAVTAVSISASRIAQVIASDEAVKFKPTGTLFASAVARFAMTAPLPAGKTMASRFSGECLRRYRLRAIERPRSFPRVSVLPSIPSMTMVEKGERLSPRMARRAKCSLKSRRCSKQSAPTFNNSSCTRARVASTGVSAGPNPTVA